MGVAGFDRYWPALWLVVLLAAGAGARADDGEGDQGDSSDGQASAPKKNYEGAIGLAATYGAAFPGSSDIGWKAQPAGFIRWGRYTLTGAGGFTTRRNDDVERGLAAEVVRRRTWHLSLGLRYDDGRKESESADLAGMGAIPATVRGRLSLRWDPVPEWRYGLTANFDLLNRDGGITLDAGISRRWFFGPDRYLALTATVGAADGRYMQSWHGVTAGQSLASGYAPYYPDAGWRNAGLSVIWRQEIGEHWTGFIGASVGHLLGPAADSPLTQKTSASSLQGGLAWRF